MNNRSACLFHYADKEIITEFYKVNNRQIAVCVIQQNLTLKYIIICANVFFIVWLSAFMQFSYFRKFQVKGD